jgi:pyruvate/2-oxoglutarate dehydrogenase complex dihydrolipoamide dehydrogenase (E3) component
MPNSDRLGLDTVGLEPDALGFLRVDGQLRTPVEDIFAFGDLKGPPMFTHTARDDADVLYRSTYQGQSASIDRRVVPHAVFCDPEVGAVGLTEAAARAAGHDVIVGRAEFQGVARARAMDETRGFLKFVVDAGTDRILGAHFFGPEAAELIHEAVIAMVGDIPYRDIARAIHIHPTLAEGVNGAAGGVHRPAA